MKIKGFYQRFEQLSPGQRERFEKRLKKAGLDIPRYGTGFSKIPCVEKKEYYSLSSAQKRMYVLQQLAGGSTGYNVYSVVILEEEIDKNRVKDAFAELLRRHEILRTSFVIQNGELVQKIDDYVELDIEYYNKVYRKDYPIEKMLEDFITPFDLSKAPLMKVRFIKTGRAKYILLFDIHHIIIDNITKTILGREFAAIYSGMETDPVRLQYKDFAEWQNSEATQEKIKRQEFYWLKVFSGGIPVLNLPVDYARTLHQDHKGDEYDFELSEEITAALKKLMYEKDVTLFMFLIAAYNVLLSRLSGQEDIVVGIPFEGRNNGDLRRVLGMLVNIIAFRNFPGKNKTFSEFIKEVKKNAIEAFSNQDYQFENLLDKLKYKRDPGRNPIFDTVFNLQDANRIDNISGSNLGKLKCSLSKLNKKQSRYDINIYCCEVENKVCFNCTYKTSLFKAATIKYIMGEFKRLLEQILTDPGKCLKDYKTFSEHEILPGYTGGVY